MLPLAGTVRLKSCCLFKTTPRPVCSLWRIVSPSLLLFLVDIWSVGCIFAEMLGGKVLFPGRDCTSHCLSCCMVYSLLLDVHQLNLIINILGTPPDETIKRIGSPRAQDYVRSLPRMPKVPYSRLFPNASANGTNPLYCDHGLIWYRSVRLVGKVVGL